MRIISLTQSEDCLIEKAIQNKPLLREISARNCAHVATYFCTKASRTRMEQLELPALNVTV